MRKLYKLKLITYLVVLYFIMRLTSEFFNRNTVTVARDLLGKKLVRRLDNQQIIKVRITETEAYHGLQDKASHASRGMTPRNEIMFGSPGALYIYLIYGMYHCLNFVTMRDGFPAAVLVRAATMVQDIRVSVESGFASGGKNQNNSEGLRIEKLNGPGKLCRELRIDRSLNGLKPDNDQLWIEDDGEKVSANNIRRSKRMGVNYAGEWKNKLWRFSLETRT